LTSVTRDALIASHRAERDADPQSWWATTNLLTMMMLTPEFNLA
jgi:hypothetical protein